MTIAPALGQFFARLRDHWIWLLGLWFMLEPAADSLFEGYRSWADRYISRHLRSRVSWIVAISTAFVACFLAFQDQFNATIIANGKRDTAIGERDEARRQLSANAVIETSFPLSEEQEKRLGEVLENVPKEKRFPITVACPDSAAIYANKMAAVFKSHGWGADASCNFLIQSTGTGIGFALSADVVSGKKKVSPNGAMLMELLDSAHIKYEKTAFDVIHDDSYWLIVALPPIK
ncbi:MAG: hypothetical protein ACLQF1_01825 [Methyloceanibacter sp.]